MGRRVLSALKRKLLLPDIAGEYAALTQLESAARLALIQSGLATEGESLTSADFLTPDTAGRPALSSPRLLEHIAQIIAILHENGGALEPGALAGYMFTIVEKRTPVPGLPYPSQPPSVNVTRRVCVMDLLLEKRLIAKLFQPSSWVNRLDEMDALWAVVPKAGRMQVNYEEIYKEVAALCDEHPWSLRHDTTREALLSHNALGRCAFEYRWAWKNLPALATLAEYNGEEITPEDFLATTKDGVSLFHAAAKLGVFEHALAYWAALGPEEKLRVLKEAAPGTGKSTLAHLLAQEKLDLLMRPEAWVGQVEALAAVLEALEQIKPGAVDSQAVVDLANAVSVSALAERRRSRG